MITDRRTELTAALAAARNGDVSWAADAACDGADVDFYADDAVYDDPTAVADWEPARRLCQTCPAQTNCLAKALVDGEAQGMWGGATPTERYQLAHALGINGADTEPDDNVIPFTRDDLDPAAPAETELGNVVPFRRAA